MDSLLAILPILAWPLVILILGIVAILTLKQSLRGAVDRAKKMKIGPAELSTEPIFQESAKNIRPTSSDEAMKIFDNQLLVSRDEVIKKDLDARTTPNDRERVLIRHFSALTFAYQFEKIYNQIWGSQIAAVHFLNTRGDHGCEKSELLPFYSEGRKAFPQMYRTYPFESWSNFLESFSLMKVADNRTSITAEGREFLKYILDQHYSFQKSG